MSNPLRNPNIDYERGWFSVTVQVAHNKSVFGAIVGEVCELNALGRAVHEAWLSHPAHTPGLYIDEFVVMPNHFHAALKLAPGRGGPGPREWSAVGGGSRECGCNLGASGRCAPNLGASGHCARGLSFVIGKFKSYSNHLYLEMKKAGRCIDIGPRLWQASFYDNLISSHEELETVRRYFRDNPKNWNHDRFGAITTYGIGNSELLSSSLVAFVASEAPTAVGGGPREWSAVGGGPREWGVPGRGGPGPREAPAAVGGSLREWGKNFEASGHRAPNPDAPGHRAPNPDAPGHRAPNLVVTGPLRPVISTFTSPEEREVRAKCLRAKRPFVWVCPGGIWDPLPPPIARACDEGWAFVCSPVPAGTRVNKQCAIWCNQYVIKQAASVWVDSIRPGGSLETLLDAIKGKERRE